MHAERLVKILAANPNPDPAEAELARALVMSDSPPRDLEAEAELSRALARSGGDGMTACGEDAGLCPKPRLRHRRVNAGVWPNWRMRQYRRWDFEPENCPARHEYENDRCQDFAYHLRREELKRKTENYIQNRRNQEWDYDPYATPPIFWSNEPEIAANVGHLAAIFDLSAEQAAQLFVMAHQGRNISDNMGIWNRESSEIIIEPEPMQWAVSSNIPRLFEGRTYRFDFIDPSPSEPLPASALPLVEALVSHPQPSQDSSTSTSLPTQEPTQGHPKTPAPPQSSPSRSS